ncbi:hypothetical protein VCCP1050_0191, partial [Vibrio cholerae CP1050(23)]
MVAHLVWD